MPGGDGIGPGGMGGKCTSLWMSGQIQKPLCMGFGGGFGRGRGFRNVYRTTGLPLWARVGVEPILVQGQKISKEQETQMLENQANIMEQELKEIKTRIEKLKKIE